MSALLASGDAVAESERLIAALERHRADMPFVEAVLAVHRPTHRELENCRTISAQAVDAWRTALARRWECEIAGRRLYKQIFRQFVEHYGGAAAPEVQVLSRGEAEANSTPSELLRDLRRLEAALASAITTLPFAARRLPDVEKVCAALEQTIAEANACEAHRRVTAIDRRMAQEAYRRARSMTHRALIEHYGGVIDNEFAELFE